MMIEMREQGIKRTSNKKIYKRIRVEFDRAIDRNVMALRRMREGKTEPAEDHLIRALEYLVDLKAMSNELISRYQNSMKDARRKKRELVKMRGCASDIRAAYMPEIFKQKFKEATQTPNQTTKTEVEEWKFCGDCGSKNIVKRRSSNRLLNPRDGIIRFHRDVCGDCGCYMNIRSSEQTPKGDVHEKTVN